MIPTVKLTPLHPTNTPPNLPCLHAQAALRDKSKQMKVMGAEVSMYAAQCDALRTEIASMGREMDALKKRYFAMKKQQQQVQGAQE